MRWWRRREAATATDVVPAPRIERALVAFAVHAQQLDERLERLERRLDASEDATLDLPTHDDLLDVRLHSARVAAELVRVTVELRSEIERAAIRGGTSARDQRAQALAEVVIDLADGLDTQPADVA